ncbi:hypothetical protein [Actinoplanes sp. NPDC049265]|uniref:5'-methylthioadenosine/S-adenosylhomocysteine nucleosidase family protein n=1 Tax=Actinoplanes sp. NPDC049265 TaxID=3363902 RepID=UPI0037233652
MPKVDYDFAVIAVQEDELNAILQRVTLIGIRSYRDRDYIDVTVDDANGAGRLTGVIVPMHDVGRVEAAITTMRLLEHVQARHLLLVGVAGGFPSNGVALGDVLVASSIVDYEFQRVANPVEYRLRTFLADKDLLEASRAVNVKNEYNGRVPKVHYGSVMSGDKVIASEAGISNLLHVEPLSVGVEMEGAGVAAALIDNGGAKPFLMIRGVVDFANDNKRSDSKVWIGAACAVVADVTLSTVILACGACREDPPKV